MFESDREGYVDYSTYIFVSAYVFFNREGEAYYAQYADMNPNGEKIIKSISADKAKRIIWEIVLAGGKREIEMFSDGNYWLQGWLFHKP